MATSLIWGAPSNGKSYLATLYAIEALLEGKRVFSSYPIIYSKPSIINKIKNIFRWVLKKPLLENIKLSTYKWEHKYVDAGLNNCTIIIDEGYIEFNCHNKLPVNEHTFFATSGHNNNDIYVIAQNYARINVAIRELANYFIYVYKFSNPLSFAGKKGRNQLTPLFFTREVYISEEDFKYRKIKPDSIYEKKRIWFNSSIASAYDTQYYRATEKKINPVKWIDAMNQKNVVDEMNEEKMKEEFIKFE